MVSHTSRSAIGQGRQARRRALTLLAAALLALAGCGGGSDEPREASGTGSFVGPVTGSDAFVAVVAGKENVTAYVCDGGRGIAELFGGRRDEDRIALRSDSGARLEAELGADGVAGTVTVPGRGPLRFEAVAAEGKAGLYWAMPRDQRPLAWVVLNDGRQRGTLAASRIDTSTSTATIRSTTLAVARVDPGRVSATGFGGGGFNFG